MTIILAIVAYFLFFSPKKKTPADSGIVIKIPNPLEGLAGTVGTIPIRGEAVSIKQTAAAAALVSNILPPTTGSVSTLNVETGTVKGNLVPAIRTLELL